MPSHNHFSIFEATVTPKIIDHIVLQTDLYAEQTGKIYISTNALEIRVLLGINCLMGIKSQISYPDYWSSRPELNDGYISEPGPDLKGGKPGICPEHHKMRGDKI